MKILNNGEMSFVGGILINKGENKIEANEWEKLKALPYVQLWIKGGFWKLEEESINFKTVTTSITPKEGSEKEPTKKGSK